MSSDNQQVNDEAKKLLPQMLQAFENQLEPHKYDKDGLVFTFHRNENIGLVVFQETRRSSSAHCKFYVNMYIYSSSLGEILDQQLDVNRGVVSGYHWFDRVAPRDGGRWFEIDANSDLIGVAGYVAERAQAEIAESISDEALGRIWQSGASPGLSDFQRVGNLAAISASRGSWDRSRLLLAELKDMSRGKPFETTANWITKRIEARHQS